MPTPAAVPAIAVEDLFFSYSPTEAPILKGISLRVDAGDIVIMTGPSGSGKSTFLTIVGALRHATQGRVRVFGKNLIGASAETMLSVQRQTGYIFQEHNLLESLTALQNVSMTLELDGALSEHDRHQRSAEMLAKVGLSGHEHKKPVALSGGQRQRVSIARALVGNPRMVLADEPTASLDKASGQACVEVLKALALENGTTIFLVSHDYRILNQAHRIIELDDGMIRSPSQ
ncbi:MAG: ATP-binding cassette domain-containing protein [Alphaproteobacteria bacterium]